MFWTNKKSVLISVCKHLLTQTTSSTWKSVENKHIRGEKKKKVKIQKEKPLKVG